MNAGARTALVAVALAGFVGAVAAVSRTPDPPPTPMVTPVAAAARIQRAPRVHAAAADPEPSPEVLSDEPIAEVAPAAADTAPEPQTAASAHRGENVVVRDALAWFKRRQSDGGSWGDAGATGVALLAFLGGGETHQSGTCRETVKSGLKHLCDAQDADGCLAPRDAPHGLRDHAIAGLALVEAYGMTSARQFKEPAQRAVAFAMKTRAPSSGWNGSDGRLDFEATVWMSMLVKSAKLSELDVDITALADSVTAIDELTDPATGRVHLAGSALSDDAATAMGMLVRIFAGHTLNSDPVLAAASALVREKRPDVAAPDLLYWYFGTQSAFQVGGQTWGRWNWAMQTAILDRQHAEPDADDRGSWEPTDLDRTRTTAFLTLCTEARFRYPRVISMQPK